jgi:hypothetical protein
MESARLNVKTKHFTEQRSEYKLFAQVRAKTSLKQAVIGWPHRVLQDECSLAHDKRFAGRAIVRVGQSKVEL